MRGPATSSWLIASRSATSAYCEPSLSTSPHGGESGGQSQAGVGGAFERAERFRFHGEAEHVSIVAASHTRHQVGVAIDQTRKHGGKVPVDDPRMRRARPQIRRAADFFDALTLDQHGGVFAVTSGFEIEKPAGLQEYLIGRLALADGQMRVAGAKYYKGRDESRARIIELYDYRAPIWIPYTWPGWLGRLVPPRNRASKGDFQAKPGECRTTGRADTASPAG